MVRLGSRAGRNHRRRAKLPANQSPARPESAAFANLMKRHVLAWRRSYKEATLPLPDPGSLEMISKLP
jgi:hypothetical protein